MKKNPPAPRDGGFHYHLRDISADSAILPRNPQFFPEIRNSCDSFSNKQFMPIIRLFD